MGRNAHELEKRNLPEIIASLKAKGDLIGLQKLYCIFDAIRDAAQHCDIALVDHLSKQLDAITVFCSNGVQPITTSEQSHDESES